MLVVLKAAFRRQVGKITVYKLHDGSPTIEIARQQPNWISNSLAARYHVIKEMLFRMDDG
jgi:hypothetical protein